MYEGRKKQEVRLADYRPAPFAIPNIYLVVSLFSVSTVVSATSVVRRQDPDVKAMKLDGGPFIKLLSVSVDGVALDPTKYQVTDHSLTLEDVPESFELCVVTELLPAENTRLEGLYQSGGNFYTQCEAEGFRHITFFLDRPDTLSLYDVRIEADKSQCPILLSNGNSGLTGDLPDGRHFAEWHDPFPKPCYLFALVAGNFACNSGTFKTADGNEVTINLFVDKEDLPKTEHALLSLQKAMAWDELTYGLQYDLEIYNIVAVADFNMGAMENKGLNIFNTKYVLASADTATDDDYDHVEGVIGHEYFHNWSGNRVTCRDWFQLSLKEGLTVYRDQEFSSDMGSRSLKRLDDVRILRLLQFSEDAGPLAHPVRPDKYIEINNFYTATVYNKGAELIRMMRLIIGNDHFMRGIGLYFERHDGQAVTCEDFVRAMTDASGVDLQQFCLWYSQAGTPRVEISRKRVGKNLELTFTQSCPPTPGQPHKKPFHIPVSLAWLNPQGKTVALNYTDARRNSSVLELRAPEQTFVFENVSEGVIPSLFRGFSAPIICKNDFTAAELALLMQHDTDAFTRWEASQTLAMRVISGRLSGMRELEFERQFHAAFTRVLMDASNDLATIAELLTLPSEIDVGQHQSQLDAVAIQKSRNRLIRKLIGENRAGILSRYNALKNNNTYDLSQSEKGRRKLRNVLLRYLTVGKDGADLVLAHFTSANNMTDKLAALALISDSKFAFRDEILKEFYAAWQHDALVVDKWFAVQANSSRKDIVKIVKRLARHPAFSLRNPNRVRSLVSTFSMGNQAGFHSESGEGYFFLADMITRVDALNPQTAARLVAPLGRWARLSEPARSDMQTALKGILDHQAISDDVREMCNKSLK